MFAADKSFLGQLVTTMNSTEVLMLDAVCVYTDACVRPCYTCMGKLTDQSYCQATCPFAGLMFQFIWS